MPDSASPPGHQSPTADHSDDDFHPANEWPDEEEEDDMDFEPTSEATDNIEFIDEEDDDSDEEEGEESDDDVAQATGLFRRSPGCVDIIAGC
jgi:WD repeat-containing protein 23